ncbi:MAG TPA: sigma-70 family RNA polymerase sigma factor [Vicinamibacterales bacterium]|nr:sigma-70 family RNA polymerase sigma factor [Vicinamibacterales bacterium]
MAVAGERAGLRMVEPAPERRILERMAAGDGDALRELYDLHGRAVYSLAVRILRSQPDAEDIVQEVFVQAWRQAARYDATRGTVVGWLLMQAKSRSIDRLRARKARPEQADDAQRPEPVDTGVSADVQVVRVEQAQRVKEALERLPVLQKTALELAYYEGLTHVEIAEQLEQPLGTVKTRIRQGLLKLRDALGGTGMPDVMRDGTSK